MNDEAPTARGWLWAQLLIGWTPVLALYATILVAMHGGSPTDALLLAVRAIGAAALLSIGVLRLVRRVTWPRPVRISFVFVHVAGALTFAAIWVLLTTAVESLVGGRNTVGGRPNLAAFMIMGIWLYVAVAGVAYAATATARAARAEATAARSQLAALRGQLNPHFLFNALHTVVQLIPVEPARAAEAAELLAGLLRSATETDRDLISLREERDFVTRYLAIEALRFGDRLSIRWEIADGLEQAVVPSFVLQTLVENAVRHGAAPREARTTITVGARVDRGTLVLDVADDGVGLDLTLSPLEGSAGTGLRRLRERLVALHGEAASLHIESRTGAGFTAHVRLPWEREDDASDA